jgi:uncharacterized protein YfaA (DUF2138 family)
MTDFEKRTQEVLEESTARLDGRTRSRLTQARHAALARLDRPRARSWRTWVPAGAAAAAAGLVVVMYAGRPGPVAAPPVAVEDSEILADVEAPDVTVDSDELEFNEWAGGEVET